MNQSGGNTHAERPVVLLTGASTGIGLALAHALVSIPFRVMLTARRDSLPRFAKLGFVECESVMIRALDVTCADQANQIVSEIRERWGGVDILINNAGVAYRAVMEHLEDEDEEDQFHINYLGPLHLIRQVLPEMRAKRYGRIINLSSVGGMMAMPTMGGYSASKFALEGASEALWYELKPWGIKVSLIEPGFVHSNSFQNAIFTEKSRCAAKDSRDPYHNYYANMTGFISQMMRRSPTTPDDIAALILKTIRQKEPPLRVSATPDAVFFSVIRRLLPSRLYHYLLYRFLPKIKTWAPGGAPSPRP